MLHKPALLGILGAIIGLEGYKELGKIPEYYEKFKDLKIGIAPLEDTEKNYHEKGNFQKTVIKYSNTMGYANKGATYLTEEATLIAPAYRCYILLNTVDQDQAKLYEYLKEGKAEYLPYFGKNEFYAWWDSESFKEYDFEVIHQVQNSFKIKTLISRNGQSIQEQKEDVLFDFFSFEKEEATYMYFERLPVGFDEVLNQYKLGEFAYTTFKIKPNTILKNLYFLKSENYYVHLH